VLYGLDDVFCQGVVWHQLADIIRSGKNVNVKAARKDRQGDDHREDYFFHCFLIFVKSLKQGFIHSFQDTFSFSVMQRKEL
jgi:hypothetical protein